MPNYVFLENFCIIYVKHFWKIKIKITVANPVAFEIIRFGVWFIDASCFADGRMGKMVCKCNIHFVKFNSRQWIWSSFMIFGWEKKKIQQLHFQLTGRFAGDGESFAFFFFCGVLIVEPESIQIKFKGNFLHS